MKKVQFINALNSFSNLVVTDLHRLANELDPILIDAIENGMVQKFEYTIELCWKSMKHFLLEKEGIESKSPKQVIKAFYTTGHINKDIFFIPY